MSISRISQKRKLVYVNILFWYIMISSLTWAKRACAAAIPQKHLLSEQEAQEILLETKLKVRELKSHTPTECNNDQDKEITQKYNFDDYDISGNSESEDDGFSKVFSNIQDLTMDDESDSDYTDDEDKKDLELCSTDHLIIATRIPEDDDVTQLEYYVYEDGLDNLYIHHDIMLPSYALCLEWINYSSSKENTNTNNNHGNMVAVGTFDPEIEIWNLDYIDPVYPEWILGGSGSKKKSADSQYTHTDSVLCLSWNHNQKQFLVSGSADTTIKLWDLNSSISYNTKKKSSLSALRSFSNHKDKVQSIQWHPKQSPMLASAGYDKRVCVFDTRQPNDIIQFHLSNDPEVIKWDPFLDHQLIVSDESGTIHFLDTRNMSNNKSKSASIFKFQAHEKAASCMDLSLFISSFMLTGSLDHTLKLWDIKNPTDPVCLVKRDFHLGKLFNARFSLDSPFLIALAGNEGELTVWNLKEATANESSNLLSVRQVMETRLSTN